MRWRVAQSVIGGGGDREVDDDNGDDDFGQQSVAEPEHEDRSEGIDGYGLGNEHEGQKPLPQQAAVLQGKGGQQSQDDADKEAEQDFQSGDAAMVEELAAAVPQAR